MSTADIRKMAGCSFNIRMISGDTYFFNSKACASVNIPNDAQISIPTSSLIRISVLQILSKSSALLCPRPLVTMENLTAPAALAFLPHQLSHLPLAMNILQHQYYNGLTEHKIYNFQGSGRCGH